jgi:hypothetical protein
MILVEVRAHFVKPDGTIPHGRVEFQLVSQATDPAHHIIAAMNTVTAKLDETGSFTTHLYATDDPDILPSNLLWMVREFIAGVGAAHQASRIYLITVESSPVGGYIDLASKEPVESLPLPGPAYVLTSTFNGAINTLQAEIDGLGAGGALHWQGEWAVDIVYEFHDIAYLVDDSYGTNVYYLRNTEWVLGAAPGNDAGWDYIFQDIADLRQLGGHLDEWQHGSLTWGTQHAAATEIVNGFMAATDKVILDGLPAIIATEGTVRGDADTVLTNDLAAEVTNRANADTSEATTRATADTSEATTRATADTNEATTRASADTTLTTNLATEVTNRTDADAAEATARSDADTTEATTRATADTTLTSNLTAEVTNRTTADTTEATTRATADTTLTSNLATEVTNRTNADTTITTNLATEVTNRTNADTTEATTRAAADTAESAARVSGDAALAASAVPYHPVPPSSRRHRLWWGSRQPAPMAIMFILLDRMQLSLMPIMPSL